MRKGQRKRTRKHFKASGKKLPNAGEESSNCTGKNFCQRRQLHKRRRQQKDLHGQPEVSMSMNGSLHAAWQKKCSSICVLHLASCLQGAWKKAGFPIKGSLSLATIWLQLRRYQYSSHALMAKSSTDIVQKALMKALAKRALVMSGMFKSMAALRIL